MLGELVAPTNIFDQLKRDEGIRLKPYRDTVGKLTIGVGRNLDDEGISEAESDFMLRNDLNFHELGLRNALPWVTQLDPIRYAVLLNMAFNMGVVGLKKFHNMLALAQAGDYDSAANEMATSVWANQVGVRAKRLETQMRTGVWQ